MPTKNPRINITFEESVAGVLAKLAEQENKSVAALVRELALEALETREDMYLSRVAEQADTESARRVEHKDAWK